MSLKLIERMPSGVLDEGTFDDSAAILARFLDEAERVVTATRAPAAIDRRPAPEAAKIVPYSHD